MREIENNNQNLPYIGNTGIRPSKIPDITRSRLNTASSYQSVSNLREVLLFIILMQQS